MDCPTCGLANPPGALRCDCGYDFEACKPSDTPGWEIHLAWKQMLAAFWSISWPAWAVSFALVFLFTSGYSVDLLQDHLSAITVGANLAFFVIQAILTPRVVRKNYRSFRVYVVRDGGARTRELSIREVVLVWLWILGPQLGFLLLMFVIGRWWGTTLSRDTIRGVTSLAMWLRVLFVGPYSVGLAIRVKYPAFRLQPYGLRYV